MKRFISVELTKSLFVSRNWIELAWIFFHFSLRLKGIETKTFPFPNHNKSVSAIVEMWSTFHYCIQRAFSFLFKVSNIVALFLKKKVFLKRRGDFVRISFFRILHFFEIGYKIRRVLKSPLVNVIRLSLVLFFGNLLLCHLHYCCNDVIITVFVYCLFHCLFIAMWRFVYRI